MGADVIGHDLPLRRRERIVHVDDGLRDRRADLLVPLLDLCMERPELRGVETVALEEGQHLVTRGASIRPRASIAAKARSRAATMAVRCSAVTLAWVMAASSCALIIRFILGPCIPGPWPPGPPGPCANA